MTIMEIDNNNINNIDTNEPRYFHIRVYLF